MIRLLKLVTLGTLLGLAQLTHRRLRARSKASMFTPLLPPPGIPTARNTEQRSNHLLPLSTNPNLHTGMTDKPEQAAPHSDQTEGQTAGAPQDREISPDKLKEILEQRQKWAETGEKEIKRANLWVHKLQEILEQRQKWAETGGKKGKQANLLVHKVKEILDQRQKWAETGEKEGKQANLQDANPEGGQPSPSGVLQGPRRKAPHRSPDRIRPYTAFVRQTWGPHGQAGVDRGFLNYLRGLVLLSVFGYMLFMW